jgi:hypothetical protein
VRATSLGVIEEHHIPGASGAQAQWRLRHLRGMAPRCTGI